MDDDDNDGDDDLDSMIDRMMGDRSLDYVHHNELEIQSKRIE